MWFTRVVAPLLTGALCLAAGAGPALAGVNYGPISHKGLKKAGAASTSSKLPLQIGLDANISGLHSALKSASNPDSDSYGKYLSLSKLQSKFGATSSVRNGVKNAFKAQGITAKIDVTHLRASATISIGKAQKMFGTKWAVYHTSTGNQLVALPVNTPKLPKGMKGNVNVVAGTRLIVNHASASSIDGGTPTRTGTVGPSCLPTTYPSAAASSEGLLPNQILAAYGIAPLQGERPARSGRQGRDRRRGADAELPTWTQFRNCFGAQGTSLQDPQRLGDPADPRELARRPWSSRWSPRSSTGFDLWVNPIDENSDDDNVSGLPEAAGGRPCRQRPTARRSPHVISVSYGECESKVSPYSESRTLVERELSAAAALGITVVVAAGDTGSSACARGVKPSKLTSSDKKPQVSWPASSPYVLAVGGTNLTLEPRQQHRLDRPVERHGLPGALHGDRGWGRGAEHLRVTAVVAARAVLRELQQADVPDVAAFADESPGYAIVCSSGVQGCPKGQQQGIAFVGGTSAATPLVAGMIALWTQQAKQQGLPRPGFVPPKIYSAAKSNPGALVDITEEPTPCSADRAAPPGRATTWRPGSARPWRIRSPRCWAADPAQ